MVCLQQIMGLSRQPNPIHGFTMLKKVYLCMCFHYFKSNMVSDDKSNENLKKKYFLVTY